MDTRVIVELVGYVGSFLVLVSFLMTSVVKLRLVNSIGGIIFMIYALIIESYPTAIMNACLVLINFYFLWKASRQSNTYELVRVDTSDSFLHYILSRNSEDIAQFFPDIDAAVSKANRAYIVTCQGDPVGVTLGRESEGALELLVDYSLPEYRDFSIGKFVLAALPREGITHLTYKGDNAQHLDYIRKLGFTRTDDVYELSLTK